MPKPAVIIAIVIQKICFTCERFRVKYNSKDALERSHNGFALSGCFCTSASAFVIVCRSSATRSFSDTKAGTSRGKNIPKMNANTPAVVGFVSPNKGYTAAAVMTVRSTQEIAGRSEERRVG